MSTEQDHLSKMWTTGDATGQTTRFKCPVVDCDFEGKSEKSLAAHFRAMHPEEVLEEKDDLKPAPKQATTIVYISLRPMLRTVRSSKTVIVQSGMGHPVKQAVADAIKIPFDLLQSGKGMFILDDNVARSYGLTFEELRDLIESDYLFKTGQIWVGAAEGRAQKGPRIKAGARSL